MADELLLKPDTTVSKRAYEGFSWTFLCFGAWVPILRGHARWSVIGSLAEGLLFTLSDFDIPVEYVAAAFIAYRILMAFLYNGIHRRALIKAGWYE